MNNTTVVELTEFIGKTLKSVNVINDEDNIKIIFEFDTGQKYKMYHEQFCCEDVYIEDITGNMQNLIDRELIMAEQVQECGENEHGTTQGLHHHQPRRTRMDTRRNTISRRQAMAERSMDRRNANLPNALGIGGMVREGRAHRARKTRARRLGAATLGSELRH